MHEPTATESERRLTWPVEFTAAERAPRVAVWVLVPLAVMLLSWHALELEPRPGLDNSWQAALHMALHEGVTFGNHFIFTYGPLGFLSVPTLWYGDTGTIAVLYTVLVRLALAAAVFFGARRNYGTIAGATVALLVVGASSFAPEAVPFLIFGVWAIDRETLPRERLGLMAVAGALAGLELLNKVSIGLEMMVMAFIVSLAVRGRRRENVTVMFGALVVALLAGWTLTGQEWGALPDYARNAVRVASGYAAAMSEEQRGLALTLEYPAGLVAVALGVFGAVQMTADGPPRRRWGILALWLAFCFFEFKEGFVRHTGNNGEEFFVALLGGFIAFSWRAERRLLGIGLTAVLLTFTVAATMWGQGSPFSAVFDPIGNARSAVRQLAQVSSSTKRSAIEASGRRAVKEAFALTPAQLALLRGHSVHVAPYQADVAWAYELDWRPLPVIQSYTAYATSLDQQDAAALESAGAPQRILRNTEAGIDGRVQAFDEGLTTRTMLCRYQDLQTTPTWQVLGLGANRCGAPVPLGVVHAGWGQTIAVPAPPTARSFVFVRIAGVGVGGLERVQALLYKPAERTVLLNGVSHRLVPATASDGLLLKAPAAVDFTPPLNLAPDSSTLAVARTGAPRGGKPITYSFYAVTLNAGPRGPFADG